MATKDPRNTRDPIARFREVYERAERAVAEHPNAAALATASGDGTPSVRMILLKGFDERGFVFYTNTESRKGQDLAKNPRAALCFWWPPLEEQVRVEGRVEPVGPEEADAYFATRERGSQIGAWVSAQSRPLASRADLLKEYAKAEFRRQSQSVPRPPFWSGYRVIPERIEFWYSRPYRLHERLLYTRRGEGWELTLVYP